MAIAFLSVLVATRTCIDKYHLFDGTVAVPVILRVVHSGVVLKHLLESLRHHVTTVIARFLSGIIVRLRLFVHLDGTIDIEAEIQQSARLVAEVVSHAACSLSLIIARLVEKLVIGCAGILPMEQRVGEFKQHHHLLVFLVGIPVCVSWRQSA